ncbi:MAG: TlpA disulfide reductase family protein [Gemmatimonadota bacterium]|nr:TlpA disulfide reductase family protein [Gemmatimonadota bacterium]MDE3006493.1 TlpA disulfide reductase family protein [Gemmatimonadota bacterium]MDE3012450.1 TlpA disulfide reductase family protein [Gemmatimonadota bacterium]
MTPRFARSPYFWAIVAFASIVLVAWIGRERYQPVITGSAAPDFTVLDMAGQEVSLSDFLGEDVLLINVWATWCGPCLTEMPSMQRLYDELQDEDFEILAISIDAPAGQFDLFGREGGDLMAFAEGLELTFPILHNPSGDIQQIYQTTGVPESFVIGKDGVIYKKVAGDTEWDASENVELIRRLLASD